MENTYTISDCLKLNRLIRDMGDVDGSLLFYGQVIEKAKKISCSREVESKDIETLLSYWLMNVHYRGRDSTKAYKFLFTIPIEEIALYVNVNDIRLFVKWRCELAK